MSALKRLSSIVNESEWMRAARGRAFMEICLTFRPDKIRQTVSGKSDAIAIPVRPATLPAAALDQTRQVMPTCGLKEWRV